MTRVRHYGLITAVIDDRDGVIDLRVNRYGAESDQLSDQAVQDMRAWALACLQDELSSGYIVNG
jgi:hypothetical protein